MFTRSVENDAAAASAKGESVAVNLPHYLFIMAFNVVGNLMLSRDLLDSQSKEGYEFFSSPGKGNVFAGSETTSTVIEWAMAELLRKPKAMKMVKEELNEVVSVNRYVEESDIDKLPYLQAV
ncbi:hypothetical protein GH714_017451 [Hevea brasiliensis]|uniref:Cytochrome P450 n=1 Tax=Hevea brasiliensis TaxID=3981 RepID=A0A6A6MAY7_HEVBR|nr:hypothetical protein GH714_017451 [Hevea brasiliensis]